MPWKDIIWGPCFSPYKFLFGVLIASIFSLVFIALLFINQECAGVACFCFCVSTQSFYLAEVDRQLYEEDRCYLQTKRKGVAASLVTLCIQI
uniref:Uncharacterized protein n=1 Tax=Rhizophora mucronata TaxID=61149 RepID=A0A2P2L066_RHIMU